MKRACRNGQGPWRDGACGTYAGSFPYIFLSFFAYYRCQPALFSTLKSEPGRRLYSWEPGVFSVGLIRTGLNELTIPQRLARQTSLVGGAREKTGERFSCAPVGIYDCNVSDPIILDDTPTGFDAGGAIIYYAWGGAGRVMPMAILICMAYRLI